MGAEGELTERFRREVSEDLMTPRAIPILEEVITRGDIPPEERLGIIRRMDEALGLNLCGFSRTELRIRPANAELMEAEVEAQLEARQAARAAKNYREAGRLRADPERKGVVVMDGDPIAWEWRVLEWSRDFSRVTSSSVPCLRRRYAVLETVTLRSGTSRRTCRVTAIELDSALGLRGQSD